MRHAALAAFLLLAAPADAATRNYTITSFDRIRVDGPYQVTLKTGVAPFARASGSQAALDAVTLKVEGTTMIVRAGSTGGWGGYPGQAAGPVTIEIGTHELGSAWINGAGSLNIDKVSGLSFLISIQGAGAMQVDSAEVDQMRVGLGGSATARLAGKVGKLNASVKGTSTFDAPSLQVKDATITAEGPVQVRATVSNTAKVSAVGLASVALSGGPTCEVKAQGSASVSGCN